MKPERDFPLDADHLHPGPQVNPQMCGYQRTIAACHWSVQAAVGKRLSFPGAEIHSLFTVYNSLHPCILTPYTITFFQK